MGRVSTRPAPPRLETRLKKPIYCPAPFVSTGTRLTRPVGYPTGTRPDLFIFIIFFFSLIKADMTH
jgi:hypothetical protein